ncbi:MAG TPA: hypothetical protein VGN91_17635 [Bosea sp. (in: a-proteobacteria)]|jgi:hypothetical protein|nr:hypothetical protein [Bosea sp. (in: a-proteobacteria)]
MLRVEPTKDVFRFAGPTHIAIALPFLMQSAHAASALAEANGLIEIAAQPR